MHMKNKAPAASGMARGQKSKRGVSTVTEYRNPVFAASPHEIQCNLIRRRFGVADTLAADMALLAFDYEVMA